MILLLLTLWSTISPYSRGMHIFTARDRYRPKQNKAMPAFSTRRCAHTEKRARRARQYHHGFQSQGIPPKPSQSKKKSQMCLSSTNSSRKAPWGKVGPQTATIPNCRSSVRIEPTVPSQGLLVFHAHVRTREKQQQQ